MDKSGLFQSGMFWFCESELEDRVANDVGIGLCTGCRQIAILADPILANRTVAHKAKDDFVLTIEPSGIGLKGTFEGRGSPGDEAGLKLELASFNGLFLIVVRVHEGPCAEWNRRHAEETIRCNDRIVAVNGLCGRPEELVRGMRQANAQMAEGNTAVTLSVRRPEQRTLQLRRARGDGLGLHMNAFNNSILVVLSIQPDSFVDKLNKDCPDDALLPGDIFAKVNGVAGDPHLQMCILRTALDLSLIIARHSDP